MKYDPLLLRYTVAEPKMYTVQSVLIYSSQGQFEIARRLVIIIIKLHRRTLINRRVQFARLHFNPYLKHLPRNDSNRRSMSS